MVSHNDDDDEQYETEDSDDYSDDEEEEVQMKPIFIPKVQIHDDTFDLETVYSRVYLSNVDFLFSN